MNIDYSVQNSREKPLRNYSMLGFPCCAFLTGFVASLLEHCCPFCFQWIFEGSCDVCVVCTPQESLIDASEDSQLEAAIRASLQETHFDSSQAKQESRSDEESESELFSGSEEFISVCGSEEESESEIPAKLRKSPHKDLGYKKEESRRPQPEPSARTEPGTASNHRVVPCMEAEESPDKAESAFRGLDVNGECPFLTAFVVALSA